MNPTDGTIEIKVYYEDTDSLGVVYYANYMKYFERGRTELLELWGRPIGDWNNDGFNFAVYKATLTFLAPARLGDRLEVRTRLRKGSPYRMIMDQEIHLGDELITTAEVHLVCLDADLQLQEFPPTFLQ
jgi:tol-pal system-associated acyl-CoA thioesterase